MYLGKYDIILTCYVFLITPGVKTHAKIYLIEVHE